MSEATAREEATGIVLDQGYVPLANPTYADAPFTDFASITPGTDLQTLNMNWRERDLPESARTKHVHRLHPYLGKFIPQLVEIFLRKFEPHCVADPFAGSGTTLVEAATFGADCFGVDISPFNCLLTKVKVSNYDVRQLRFDLLEVLKRSKLGGPPMLFGAPEKAPRELQPTEYIRRWFAPRAQEELLAYCAQIPRCEHMDVMKIILSRAARSARLVAHHELDFPKVPQVGPYHCRKHDRVCSPVEEARKFLDRYTVDTIARIGEFMRLRKSVLATVICGDSREIEFPPADLIVTSPPYVGLIDYHEQHRYAYELLSLLPEPFASVGYRDADGRRDESKEIGPASRGGSERAVAAYIDGISDVFANAIRPMPSGAHIVVIVNDKRGIYPQIASKLPVDLETVLTRHVNRRTGRRTGAFYEQVLVWRRR